MVILRDAQTMPVERNRCVTHPIVPFRHCGYRERYAMIFRFMYHRDPNT